MSQWYAGCTFSPWRAISGTEGGRAMKPLVTDALWQRLRPLLPPPPPRRFCFPGRKPLDYRQVLTGILFVLKTGIAWDDLPAELGCGCGKTCRHYLRLWHQAPRVDGCPRHPLECDGDGGQRQRGDAGLPGVGGHASRGRQAGSQTSEAGAAARRWRLRLGAGAAVAALAGDHAGAGGAEQGTRQRAGGVPLVRGADHLVAACLRAAATPAGPAHGDTRGVPPPGLWPYLFAVLGTLNSFFPNALSPPPLSWCPRPRHSRRRRCRCPAPFRGASPTPPSRAGRSHA